MEFVAYLSSPCRFLAPILYSFSLWWFGGLEQGVETRQGKHCISSISVLFRASVQARHTPKKSVCVSPLLFVSLPPISQPHTHAHCIDNRSPTAKHCLSSFLVTVFCRCSSASSELLTLDDFRSHLWFCPTLGHVT